MHTQVSGVDSQATWSGAGANAGMLDERHSVHVVAENDATEEAARLQNRVDELEAANRATRHTIGRLRQQLALVSCSATRNQLELARAEVENLCVKRHYYHTQIRLLMLAVEGYHQEMVTLFGSPQWRLGEKVARLRRRLSGRHPESTLARSCRDAHSGYLKWRGGFESRAQAPNVETLLEGIVDFASPTHVERRLQELEYAAQILGNEVTAARRDIRHLSGHFENVRQQSETLRTSPQYRFGLWVMQNVARCRKQPNTALYLTRLEERSRQFEDWREAYIALSNEDALTRR